MYTHEYESYCEECYNKVCVIECCLCSNDSSTYDIIEYNGNNYCQECYDELFFVCEDCLEVINKDDLKSHNNNSLCQECYGIRIEDDIDDLEEIA